MDSIRSYFEPHKGGKVTLGIDGFVDEVWQIVSLRKSDTDYDLHNSMTNFAKSVYDSGEGGYTSETVRKRRIYGGFTGNTGSAVGALGFDLSMVGFFGNNSIDSAFSKFEGSHKMYSLGEPGICNIFEFEDGKLMLPFTDSVSGVKWEDIVKSPSYDAISKAYMEADIVGLGYWFLLRNFDELVTKLYENLLIKGKCSRLFLDFADIRKRDEKALLDTLKTLSGFGQKIPMTLSLNEHEGAHLFSCMEKSMSLSDPESVAKDIEYVRQQTGLDEVIVHTPYFAVGASASEGVETVLQDYCENPVITTGAGDNFNGGYTAASARKGELTFKERLLVANAVAGFYVKNGHSPCSAKLLNELSRKR